MHGLFNCQPLSPARSHPWRLLFAGPTGNAVFAGVAIGLYVKSGYNEVRILDQIMPWAFASAVGLQHLTSSSFVQKELVPEYVWLPFEVLAFQRETIFITMPIIPSSPEQFLSISVGISCWSGWTCQLPIKFLLRDEYSRAVSLETISELNSWSVGSSWECLRFPSIPKTPALDARCSCKSYL